MVASTNAFTDAPKQKGNVKGKMKSLKRVLQSRAFRGLNPLLVCHVALRRKNIKAAKNVKIFAVVYERGLRGQGKKPFVYGAKNALWWVHFVCPTFPPPKKNFLGLFNGRNCVIQIVHFSRIVWNVGYKICESNFFFLISQACSTSEIALFKLFISRALYRMEVIKSVITKEIYFVTEM